MICDKLLSERALDKIVTNFSFMKINGVSIGRLGDATEQKGVIVEGQDELLIE